MRAVQGGLAEFERELIPARTGEGGRGHRWSRGVVEMGYDAELRLFEGLLWYLEARNWAFEKMKASPHGSDLFDLRMHHSLFFVNLMSAVDHVADYLKCSKAH